VGESLAAIGTLKWLLSTMNPDMLFEVMLEFESLLALRTLEFP